MAVARQLWAGGRLISFLVWTLVCVPFYRLEQKYFSKRRVAQIWFRAINKVVGLKSGVSGIAHQHGPVLYVANHVSYLDIVVLGALLDAVFVAKSDVAKWPVFGGLARMAGCIFVTRKAANVQTEIGMIHNKLAMGRNVILFPEGTTGRGGTLLPFKSSLLAALDGIQGAMVQPLSIVYPDRKKGGADASLAWVDDMMMLPHLWRVLQRSSSPARVVFHPAVAAEDFSDRKALAGFCRAHIASGVNGMLAPAPTAPPASKPRTFVWGAP